MASFRRFTFRVHHAVVDDQVAADRVIRVFHQLIPSDRHRDPGTFRGVSHRSVCVHPVLLYGNVDGIQGIHIVDIEFKVTVIPVDSVDVLVFAENLRNAAVYVVRRRIFHTGVPPVFNAVVPPDIFCFEIRALIGPGLSVHILDGPGQVLLCSILRDIDHTRIQVIIVCDTDAAVPDRNGLVMNRMVIETVVIISRLAAGIDIHIHADHVIRSCRSAPVDMENGLHVFHRNNRFSRLINKILCNLDSPDTVLVLIRRSQGKVHARGASLDPAYKPVRSAPANRRAFILQVPVVEGGRQFYDRFSCEALVRVVLRCRLLGGIQRETVVLERYFNILCGCDRIVDPVLEPLALHIVVHRIHRIKVSDLEDSFNTHLVGACVVFRVSGVAGHIERVVNRHLCAVLVNRVGGDVRAFDVVPVDINLLLYGDCHRVLPVDDQLTDCSGFILVEIFAVRQRNPDRRVAFNRDIDMVHDMVPVIFIVHEIGQFRHLDEIDLRGVVLALPSGNLQPAVCLYDPDVIPRVGLAADVVVGISELHLAFVHQVLVNIILRRGTARMAGGVVIVLVRVTFGNIRIQVAVEKVRGQVLAGEPCFLCVVVQRLLFIGPDHGIVNHQVSGVVVDSVRLCQGSVIVDDVILSLIFGDKDVAFIVVDRGRIFDQAHRIITGVMLVPARKTCFAVKLIQVISCPVGFRGQVKCPVSVVNNRKRLRLAPEFRVRAPVISAFQAHVLLFAVGNRKDVVFSVLAGGFKLPHGG